MGRIIAITLSTSLSQLASQLSYKTQTNIYDVHQ